MRNTNLPWLWLSIGIFIIDYVSKSFIVKLIPLNSAINVSSFFMLIHARNYGAAFSFLDVAGGWQRWLFVLVPIFICVGIISWLMTLKNKPTLAAALALVLGGALGNLYGRVVHGYVVDFLYFHLGQYGWPAFNVADSAVCVGAAIVLWHLFFTREQH